jgi:HAE1 family hydrophobic/amphiphilic exporter-1
MRQPLCVLLTVPMALIGVFLLFFYINASFTREAYIGVIMMSGVVVNNAILLIDHVNQLRRNHGLPLAEALERGTLERVRPILMTSLVTICGLLPLVLFSKDANQNIWNALTYSMIGGLSSSTILVLTVTPSLYLIFERRGERKKLAKAAQLAVPSIAEAHVQTEAVT